MPNVAQQMNSIRQNYQQGDRVTLTPGNNLSGLEKAIVNSITNDTSNVKVLRSKEGQFLGVVDLNDNSRHVISNMDDLDINLGIIKPYEMSMLADPRGAQQLNKKRNWNNRGSILDSIYQSQFARPEPAKDDQRTSELFAKQTKGQQLDLEAEQPVFTRARPAVEPVSTMARAARPAVPVKELPPPPTKVALTGPEQHALEANMAFQTAQPPVDWAAIRKQEAEQAEADRSREWSDVETAQLAATRPPVRVRRTNEQPFVAAPVEADAAPGEATPVEEPAFVAPDPNAVNIQALPESAQVLSEKPLDSFSPQEQSLLDYHRDNLFNNKFLRNEDGSVTTLYSMTFEAEDGRIYMIPGYDSESRKTLEFNDALNRALEVGLENFPSYETREQARQAEEDLHKVIELDMMKFERENRNMQVGGQVPQINRSGLIQGEGGPTSDSIPMQAEPNSFIINAPAVQMAGGAKKLDDMVQQQQQTSGFNQFGNPVTGSQGINVSNGEYKVSQPAAKKIGYKKLNKMNDAGKPFVDQLDRGGYNEGGKVEEYFTEVVIPEEFSATAEENSKKYDKDKKEYIAYKDTEKHVTFGPGVKADKNAKVGDRKSKQEIDKEAIKRWKQAVKSAKKILGSDTHNAVLPIAEMVYQMGEGKDPIGKKDQPNYKKGTGVRGFKNMLAAIAVGDSEKAYEEALDSKWYKQTKERAERVAERLKKSLRVAPDHLSNRGFVSVPLEPPTTAPAFSPGVASRFSETGRDAPKGFVNLPEEDYSEQQYREGLEEGDIIRGTLGVPESPYMSPDLYVSR